MYTFLLIELNINISISRLNWTTEECTGKREIHQRAEVHFENILSTLYNYNENKKWIKIATPVMTWITIMYSTYFQSYVCVLLYKYFFKKVDWHKSIIKCHMFHNSALKKYNYILAILRNNIERFAKNLIYHSIDNNRTL